MAIRDGIFVGDIGRLMDETFTRWAGMPPLHLELPRVDAWWALLRLLPATLDSSPDAARTAQTVCRQLQKAADTPDLRGVVEALRRSHERRDGW